MSSNSTSLRVISGILLYACVAWIMLGAHEYFMLTLLAVLAVLTGWEWFGMIFTKYKKYLSPLLLAPILISFFALEYTANNPIGKYYMTALGGVWFIFAMLQTANYELNPRHSLHSPARQTVATIINLVNAIALISIFIYFTVILFTASRELAFAVFTMVCICDTGGFIFGRWIGGRKIAKNLSPNKTFSGAAGSIFLTVLAYVIMTTIFTDLPFDILVIALIIPFSIILQCGDLYQSMLKRRASIKDSGNIIPGHGGIFDRTDSLLWSPFPFYLILELCGYAF